MKRTPAPGIGPPLDAAAMLAEAERNTGLTDWGGDEFRHPFEVLVRSINDDAQLHAQGHARTRQWLMLRLEQRLRMFDDRKRIPAIAAQNIEKPIFMTGMARAGTTYLHSLVGCDPANLMPLHWQMNMPSPPPNDPAIDHAPAIRAMRDMMAFQGWSSPEMLAIHPYDACGPEECGVLFEPSFINTNFLGYWDLQGYIEILAGDATPAYRTHRQVLQSLQYGTSGRRWVLKAPVHILHLKELLAVYPDAALVQNHRDPCKVMASMFSLLSAQQHLYSDKKVHLSREAAIGLLDMYVQAFDYVIALRKDPAMNARFVDVGYLDLERDPIGVVRKVYAGTGMTLTPQAQRAMETWKAAHRKGRHGSHRYSLENYGLSREFVLDKFERYIRRFNIELEL